MGEEGFYYVYVGYSFSIGALDYNACIPVNSSWLRWFNISFYISSSNLSIGELCIQPFLPLSIVFLSTISLLSTIPPFSHLCPPSNTFSVFPPSSIIPSLSNFALVSFYHPTVFFYHSFYLSNISTIYFTLIYHSTIVSSTNHSLLTGSAPLLHLLFSTAMKSSPAIIAAPPIVTRTWRNLPEWKW